MVLSTARPGSGVFAQVFIHPFLTGRSLWCVLTPPFSTEGPLPTFNTDKPLLYLDTEVPIRRFRTAPLGKTTRPSVHRSPRLCRVFLGLPGSRDSKLISETSRKTGRVPGQWSRRSRIGGRGVEGRPVVRGGRSRPTGNDSWTRTSKESTRASYA